MAPLNNPAHCKLMHVMGPSCDAYVYHYSFNHSRLFDVVRVLFVKSLASMKPF